MRIQGIQIPSDAWLRPLSLFHTVVDQEVIPDRGTLNSILACLSETAVWEQSVAILLQLTSLNVRADSSSLCHLMMSSLRGSAWAKALDTFQLSAANAYDISQLTSTEERYLYDHIVHSCARGSRWAEALQTLYDSQEERLPLPKQYKEGMMAASTKYAALARLSEIKQQGSRLTVITFNSSVAACSRSTRWQDALQLLSTVKLKGLKLDVVLVGAGMDVFAKSKPSSWLRSQAFLMQIKNSLLEPNIAVMSGLITSLASAFRWSDALLQLEMLQQQTVHWDTTLCTSAMSAVSKAELWQPCLIILSSMDTAGLHLDLHAFNTMMSAFSSSPLSTIRNLLQNTGLSSLRPDMFSFGSAAKACERQSLWADALSFLSLAYSDSVPLSDIAYNTAISSCLKSKSWSFCLDLCQDMITHGLQQDLVTFSMALTACDVGGSWEQALRFLQAMRRRSIRPHAASLSSVVTLCRRSGQTTLVADLLGEMQDVGMVAALRL